MNALPRLHPAPCCLLLSLLAGCSDGVAGASTTADERAPTAHAQGADDAPTPDALLDLAFDAAARMPLEPHVKNRARAQAEVVAARLRLDDVEGARADAERIPNWRKGLLLAEIALHVAERDPGADALADLEADLGRASLIADAERHETGQAWRRDRVRVTIAMAYERLGRHEEAARFQQDLEPSEAGRIASVRALEVDGAGFDAYLDHLDATIDTGTLDEGRHALDACVVLYDRFYADADKRARVEERIEANAKRLPPEVRVDALARLAQVALDHADAATARDLVTRAMAVVGSHEWLPEHHVPLLARLAALRAGAGDAQAARLEADAARVLYEQGRDGIVDIFRAETLVPLAEAYAAMGADRPALEVYALALDEAVLNPNSRPRVEDLVTICCSLAVLDVEPDAALWARLRDVADALGEPW